MSQMVLKVNGRIPSKKNSKQIIKCGGRPVIISSKDYIKWERDAAFSLGLQAEGHGVSLPIVQCTVSIEIMFPDARRTDLSNKAEGLLDSLVKAGVLTDDNWRVVNRLELIAIGSDKDNAGARITINIPGGV